MKLYFTGKAFYMDSFETDTNKLPNHYVEIPFPQHCRVSQQIMCTKEYCEIGYKCKPPMYMSWYDEMDKWNYDSEEWEIDIETEPMEM